MKINRLLYPSILLVCFFAALTACNKNSSAPAKQPPSTVSISDSSPIKHYPFKGKVVMVDSVSRSASIDGEDIPGFMSAMTMSYNIRPESDLQKLHTGDSIQADVVVDNSDSNNEKYWLEHVVVVSGKKEP